jgi:hypothetical protein
MAFNRTDLLARASDLALASAAPSIRRPAAKAKANTKPNKSPPRYAKLDGKPLSRPRGRHAVAHSDVSNEDDAAREVVTIPVNQRLGFRIGEFAALIGVSHVTIWRGIRDKKIDVIDQNGVKIIPRAYAIKAGYITADDGVGQ